MPESPHPLVALVADDEEMLKILSHAGATLDELRVPYEWGAYSAHYTPDQLEEYAKRIWDRGIDTVIAGENGANHLSGMFSAIATRVQILAVLRMTEHLNGFESIASALFMPSKVPVAVMGFDRAGAVNAAVHAARGFTRHHPHIAAALEEYQRRYEEAVHASNERHRPSS